MKPANEKPCRECPFRRSGGLPGFLGPYRTPADLVADVLDLDGDFPCHLTLSTPDLETAARGLDDYYKRAETATRCAGAMSFLAHRMKLPRDPDAAADRQRIGKRDDVCRDLTELTKVHSREPLSLDSGLYRRRLAKVIRDRLRARLPVTFKTTPIVRVQTRRNSSTREFELNVRGSTGPWIKLRTDSLANLVDDAGDQITADRTAPASRTATSDDIDEQITKPGGGSYSTRFAKR